MPPKKHTKLQPLPGFEKKGYLDTDAAWNTVHDLKQKGYSIRDISDRCRCDVSTVRRTLARIPPSVRERKSPVSPERTKARQKRRKKIKSVLGRKKKNGVPVHNSARRLCFAVREEVPCSKNTVLRDLQELGAQYAVRPKIPAGVATTEDWAATRVLAGKK